MTRTAKSIAAALLLTVAAGGAFAQTGYTRDTVTQADPFGALPVDPTTFAVTEGSIAALGATAIAELNARCDVVVSWPSYYGWGTAAFCQNILYAQGLIGDPNAPDSSTSGWVTVDSTSDGWVTVDSSSD
ncbi:MAG: hypothetical protein IT534_09170 [Bauldia sp.]|nr:hypothetical protein [Bauldia sp.]